MTVHDMSLKEGAKMPSETRGVANGVKRSVIPALTLRVDKPAGLVAEQYVDLLRFDDRSDLAAAKLFVGHRLAFSVLALPVIRRSILTASHRNRRFDTTSKCAHGLARFANCLRDLALLGDRQDLVILLQVASRAHHLDRLVYFVSWCFYCHKFFLLTMLGLYLPRLGPNERKRFRSGVANFLAGAAGENV